MHGRLAGARPRGGAGPGWQNRELVSFIALFLCRCNSCRRMCILTCRLLTTLLEPLPRPLAPAADLSRDDPHLQPALRLGLHAKGQSKSRTLSHRTLSDKTRAGAVGQPPRTFVDRVRAQHARPRASDVEMSACLV